VIDTLVTRRVLGLEYMEGVRIDRVEARPGDEPHDPRGVVGTVMELYLQMMLIDGLFHADPHAGNLLVAPDGKVVLLDFGMVDVPREMRWHSRDDGLCAIRRHRWRHRRFRAHGFVEPGADAKIRELADA
jgi:predicted unusual protein kinase regulating ubiquinone biosynthesis (AarF/ABC1/UbiB family)